MKRKKKLTFTCKDIVHEHEIIVKTLSDVITLLNLNGLSPKSASLLKEIRDEQKKELKAYKKRCGM